MKLIIDIPEDLYKWIKDEYDNPNEEVAYSAIENGIPYEEPKKNCFGCQGDKDFGCEDCLNKPKGDLISRDALKKEIKSYADDQYAENEYLGECAIMTIIDNAPAVEEIEKPHHSECRNRAIKENLPLYFVYYEETGVFEVYKTDTEELFEKRHCVKYMPAYEFQQLATRYLDEYSDWKGGTEND